MATLFLLLVDYSNYIVCCLSSSNSTTLLCWESFITGVTLSLMKVNSVLPMATSILRICAARFNIV